MQGKNLEGLNQETIEAELNNRLRRIVTSYL
jgi:hypothetical protein